MRALTLGAMLFGASAIVVACSGSNGDGLVGGGDGGGSDSGNPPGCPAAKPTSSATCSPSGLTCTYGCNVTATCNGGVWTVVQSNIQCPTDGGGDRLVDGAIVCSTDDDCRGPQGTFLSCSPGGRITGCGICARPQYPCSVDGDCTTIDDAAPPKPMICGPGGPCTCPVGGKNGSCIPACQGPSDCAPQEACASGHCVAKPCTRDAECPSTTYQDFACGPQGVCAARTCAGDADCLGHYCVNRICYPQSGICVPPAA